MANENALKVCYQKHAPASRVIAFKDCFMGRSVTMSQIGDFAASKTKRLTLNLKPGHYALLCNLPGHYKAGMFTDFTVK